MLGLYNSWCNVVNDAINNIGKCAMYIIIKYIKYINIINIKYLIIYKHNLIIFNYI